MNEEEIKIKHIIPWLARLGVSSDEISLERSFSIRIGRQSVIVGASQDRSRQYVGARLDILVRRNGQNLLIVETKAGDASLSDDDREQAISYARLVHPIAPYALVTNGVEFRLYDSVTKEQVDPSRIRIDGFAVSLPDDQVIEAQRLFLSLSRRNLLNFCSQQVNSELRLVKGEIGEGRKYVPELYVHRESIKKALSEFYADVTPGLLVVGPSGSGKTCELCVLAESLLSVERPTLFFNGSAIADDLLSAISNEFSWVFNDSEPPTRLIKRIESLTPGSPLTIIVDAIDEWMYGSRVVHLGALLKAAENRNIKFVMSCKSSAIGQFLMYRDNPTNFSVLTQTVNLGRLTEREYYTAIERYRKVFKVTGGIERAVLEEARDNPFLLRVIFEVAENDKHLTFSSARFFETYYQRTLKKTLDPRQAGEILRAVAAMLYKENVDRVPESAIRAKLDLRAHEPIMEELFEYAILLRSESRSGEASIGFYFQRLRDYIVAFKAMGFPAKTPTMLAEEVRAGPLLGTRGDVFALYYRLATGEHKRVFDFEVRKNATEYLHTYIRVVQEHFPSIRARLRPGTNGSIGFIGEIMLGRECIGAYGFRGIRDGEEEVHFVPVAEAVGKSNLAHLEGADYLHYTSSARGFTNGINITLEVIEHEVIEQIRGLVKEGRMDESKNPEMLSEFILETVRDNRSLFRSLLQKDGRTPNLPLNIGAVNDCILREKLIRHYRDEIINAKRNTGEIRDEWDGDFVSYSYSLTLEEERAATEKAQRALATREMPVFRATYAELQEMETNIAEAISCLRGVLSEIEEPANDWSSGRSMGERGGDYWEASICSLFVSFLANYRTFVENNFGSFRASFRFYSMLPVSVFIRLTHGLERGPRTFTNIDAHFAQGDNGQSVVKVIDDAVADRFASHTEVVVLDGVKYRPFLSQHTTVEYLTSAGPHLNHRAFRNMVLRSMVYSRVMDELPSFEKALRQHYCCDGLSGDTCSH